MEKIFRVARQMVVNSLANESREKLGVADRLLIQRFVVSSAVPSNTDFISYIESASAGAARNMRSYGFA